MAALTADTSPCCWKDELSSDGQPALVIKQVSAPHLVVAL
jgi:hypothetical protein